MRLERKRSPEELEKDLETIKIEHEIMGYKAEVAEREAVIKQLKKQYGTDWAKILGAGKWTDLSTLRSFLGSAKKGMKAAALSTNSPLSPIPSGVRKA